MTEEIVQNIWKQSRTLTKPFALVLRDGRVRIILDVKNVQVLLMPGEEIIGVYDKPDIQALREDVMGALHHG